MKKLMITAVMATVLAFSFQSCRENKTAEEEIIEEMNDAGAEVKVKDGGDKIKMETDDKEVKIKTDDDGDTKIKVDEDN